MRPVNLGGFQQYSGDIVQLSWDDVMEICREIALAVKNDFDPNLIVGIAKGGVIPAAIISSMLRVEFYPVRLSRRQQDVVVWDRPRILVPMPDEVKGKRVLIVDEAASSGETLRLAVGEAKKRGVRRVKTASLYVKTHAQRPNWYAFDNDGTVILPWDFEIIEDGRFVIHPEYEESLNQK